MSAMNPNLILQASQGTDILGAMERGNALAGQVNEQRRQNALTGFLGQNAGALMQGDQNTINVLAQHDPRLAFDLNNQFENRRVQQEQTAYSREQDALTNARADRQEARLGEQHQLNVQQHIQRVGEAQALKDAAEAERLSKLAMGFYQRGDKAGLAAMIAQEGGNPEDYPWEQIPALAQQYLDWSDIVKSMQPPAPLSPQGRFEADQRAGFIAPDAVYQPGGNTTVNVGPNGSKFTEESDKLAAGRLGDIVAEGQGAARLMGDLQSLAGLAGQIDTGKGTELLNRFGPYAEMLGVSIEGLPEMQAYQAIVDRLAPQMRAPGSGATSDFDARQFLSSLPNLARTPEGNAIINETLQSVQRQKIAAAEIAGQAQRGDISWQDADSKIAALGNPYETFNRMRERISGGASQVPQIGEMRKGYRFRGGDPADQSNWEKQ